MINGFFDEFRFLSNFWPSPISIGSESYATVEHAYQALKFTSAQERKLIREATTPGRAKRVAYKMASFRENWDEIRVPIMYQLVSIKFGAHKDLREMLLLTHPHELEETNHWGDVFWGVCNGVGENQLGKILMQLDFAILSFLFTECEFITKFKFNRIKRYKYCRSAWCGICSTQVDGRH